MRIASPRPRTPAGQRRHRRRAAPSRGRRRRGGSCPDAAARADAPLALAQLRHLALRAGRARRRSHPPRRSARARRGARRLTVNEAGCRLELGRVLPSSVIAVAADRGGRAQHRHLDLACACPLRVAVRTCSRGRLRRVVADRRGWRRAPSRARRRSPRRPAADERVACCSSSARRSTRGQARVHAGHQRRDAGDHRRGHRRARLDLVAAVVGRSRGSSPPGAATLHRRGGRSWRSSRCRGRRRASVAATPTRFGAAIDGRVERRGGRCRARCCRPTPTTSTLAAAGGRRPRRSRAGRRSSPCDAEVDDPRAVGGRVADALGDRARRAGARRASSTLTIMSFACGATPTTPRPFAAAAIDPGDVRAVAVAVVDVLAAAARR